MEEQEQKEGLGHQVVDFVDLTNAYLRQEIKKTVEGSILTPFARFGRWFALVILAAGLLVLALVFIAIGIFQLLATVVEATWIIYLMIGAIFLAGAGAAVALAGFGGKQRKEDE